MPATERDPQHVAQRCASLRFTDPGRRFEVQARGTGRVCDWAGVLFIRADISASLDSVCPEKNSQLMSTATGKPHERIVFMMTTSFDRDKEHLPCHRTQAIGAAEGGPAIREVWRHCCACVAIPVAPVPSRASPWDVRQSEPRGGNGLRRPL